MTHEYDNCIIELQKPEKERNIPVILKYIQTLKGFVNILKLTNEDFHFNLKECAKILNYSQKEENIIIVEEGEKGDSFFLILKGSVTFLVSKKAKYEMTKQQYILHLFKLRKNNSNELLKQCLQLNSLVFPIEDSFDNFIKFIVKKKIKDIELIENKLIYSKAKELYNFIKNNHEKEINITIEDYINRNNIENEEEEIEYSNDKEKKPIKKIVTIPNYIIIGKCGIGETFGELALEKRGGKRKATVITNEKTDFAVIYRNQYDYLLKNAIEKAKKKFFNVINCYNVFQFIPNYILEKKYYKLFNMLKLDKGKNLIEQNEDNDKIYIIICGDYEITTNRNLIEINDLIIYYKKFIRKFGNKEDHKLFNPNEEIKENDDLKLNKKYKTEEQNKILFEKRNIKLNIFQNRDILGLKDLMIPIDKSISKGLINCKSNSAENQVYSIDRYQYFLISSHEEGVKDLTIEYEINKMKMLIQRLNSHKERIYSFIKEKELELVKISNQNKLNQFNLKRKNRFSDLENNMIMENNEIKNVIERVEKEKEYKKKLLENSKKKINKFDIFHNKKLILPKIKIPKIKNDNSNTLTNRVSRNYNANYYDLYKESLINKNLYEGVFNSYAFTERNENEKNELKQKFLSPIVNKNKAKIYDALIFDKFNSCYSTALRKLN